MEQVAPVSGSATAVVTAEAAVVTEAAVETLETVDGTTFPDEIAQGIAGVPVPPPVFTSPSCLVFLKPAYHTTSPIAVPHAPLSCTHRQLLSSSHSVPLQPLSMLCVS